MFVFDEETRPRGLSSFMKTKEQFYKNYMLVDKPPYLKDEAEFLFLIIPELLDTRDLI